MNRRYLLWTIIFVGVGLGGALVTVMTVLVSLLWFLPGCVLLVVGFWSAWMLDQLCKDCDANSWIYNEEYAPDKRICSVCSRLEAQDEEGDWSPPEGFMAPTESRLYRTFEEMNR